MRVERAQLSQFTRAGVTMIYVGINVAKHPHYAAVMTSANETLAPSFAFLNDRAGFSLLNQTLKNYPKNNLLIGLESTAHYGENLVFFLLAQGYLVVLVNPI